MRLRPSLGHQCGRAGSCVAADGHRFCAGARTEAMAAALAMPGAARECTTAFDKVGVWADDLGGKGAFLVAAAVDADSVCRSSSGKQDQGDDGAAGRRCGAAQVQGRGHARVELWEARRALVALAGRSRLTTRSKETRAVSPYRYQCPTYPVCGKALPGSYGSIHFTVG